MNGFVYFPCKNSVKKESLNYAFVGKSLFDVEKISQNIFFEPFSHPLHYFLCQILA